MPNMAYLVSYKKIGAIPEKKLKKENRNKLESRFYGLISYYHWELYDTSFAHT